MQTRCVADVTDESGSSNHDDILKANKRMSNTALNGLWLKAVSPDRERRSLVGALIFFV